jgi:uridine kinase
VRASLLGGSGCLTRHRESGVRPIASRYWLAHPARADDNHAVASAHESAKLITAEVFPRTLDGFALIGIDGAGGSGKSTLAGELADVLGGPGGATTATVVHGDDFYRPMDPEERLRLTPAEGYELYFDWERLRDEVLAPLTSGQAADYRRYDWPSNRIVSEERHHVPHSGFVIVEGVYAVRPELEGFYDLTVFVDAPFDLCLERMIARGHDHGPGNWQQRWQAADRHYFATTEPWARLDLIVKGL